MEKKRYIILDDSEWKIVINALNDLTLLFSKEDTPTQLMTL